MTHRRLTTNQGKFGRRDRLAALRAFPLFADCTTRELQRIDRLTCEVDVPAGRVLVQQGKPAAQVLFLTAGTGRVSWGESRLGTYEPGSCLGGREVVEHVPAPVTVTAETPVTVRAASVREFRSLLDIPAIARLANTLPTLQDASRAERTPSPYALWELAPALPH